MVELDIMELLILAELAELTGMPGMAVLSLREEAEFFPVLLPLLTPTVLPPAEAQEPA